jgi:elongation factor G
VLQLPIGAESEFQGVVDLVGMRGIVWKDEALGAEFVIGPIPNHLTELAATHRTQLVEMAVEQDEAALEAYLEGEEPDRETLIRCIRAGAVSGAFVPVICGSAFKNKGVQPLLDAVVDFLPSPLDVPPVHGVKPGTKEELVRQSSDDEKFSALAFKIMNDPFVGTLTFVRIYSGVVQ